MVASLVCVFAVLVLGTGSANAKETVLIGTGEFPPFTTEITDDNGCANQIIRAAFEAEGIEIELKFVPWPRTLHLLSNGLVDALSYSMDNVDRRNRYIFPTYPITNEVYRFIYRADRPFSWSSYEDLAEVTLVRSSEYAYSGEFLNSIERIGVKTIDVISEEMILQMILRNRGDVGIINEKTYDEYAQSLSPEERESLVEDEKPAIENKGFLVFSRTDPEESLRLARAFDRGYEKIRRLPRLEVAFQVCGLRNE